MVCGPRPATRMTEKNKPTLLKTDRNLQPKLVQTYENP
jgi:hypothetical protein